MTLTHGSRVLMIPHEENFFGHISLTSTTKTRSIVHGSSIIWIGDLSVCTPHRKHTLLHIMNGQMSRHPSMWGDIALRWAWLPTLLIPNFCQHFYLASVSTSLVLLYTIQNCLTMTWDTAVCWNRMAAILKDVTTSISWGSVVMQIMDVHSLPI